MEDELKVTRLKEAIANSGLTQTEIVRRTGINKGALSSYISGRYAPKQTNLYLLAKALNVSETWLMGYDVPMTKSAPLNTSDLLSSIGNQLKYQRELKGYSISELSNMLGISAHKLEEMENGEDRNIDIELMYKTCTVLAIPYSTFINKMKPVRNIGSNLKMLRIINKKDACDVASALALDEIYIKKVEEQEITPLFSTIQKYSDFFNVPADRLMGIDFAECSTDPKFIVEIRMKYLAKFWMDTVGSNDFNDDELIEIMDFAKFLISKRK